MAQRTAKKVMERSPPTLSSILDRFPEVSFACAYGSRIQNTASKNSQLDFIFAVPDTTKWHLENLRQNPKDYSFLKFFGISTISWFQNRVPYVYYNPYCNWKDQKVWGETNF